MRLGRRESGTTPAPDGPTPLALAPDSDVFLAAARFAGGQQLFRVVRAFALIADDLPGWRLILAGSGPQRDLLDREIRRSGLGDRIEIRSEPEPAAVFVAAPRVTLPDEAFAALAGGLPVITTEVGQLFDQETALVVSAGSNPGLATAMLRLARDADLRRRLGEAGRAAYLSAVPAPVDIDTDELPAAERERHRLVTPQEARTSVLRLALAAAAGLDPVVLPGLGNQRPRLVLSQARRRDFLDALTHGPVPTWLGLRTEHADEPWQPIEAAARRQARRAPRWLGLAPAPALGLLRRCDLEVEFWEPGPDGTLVAPRPNGLVDTLPVERATTIVDGVSVPTIPLATHRRLGQVDVEIDAVFTWVDGADENWNAARERRLAAYDGTEATRESSGRARFMDHDELRHALRSIHLFAPWFRRIFLVTAGQRPAWLADDDRVSVVGHEEILPPDALPTFNSQAIETGLHRIPHLSEHFVYFNDDFLIGRPVAPETFFDGAGTTTVWYADTPVGPTGAADAAPYLKSAWNNRRLLEEHWGVTLTANLAHAPYAHRKSLLSRLEHQFPAEWHATAHAPFRSDTDLSVASSLAQHVALAEGTARVGERSLTYLDLGSPALPGRLRAALTARDSDFLCLGDAHRFGLTPEEIDEEVRGFLAAYFPVAAPWERPPP